MKLKWTRKKPRIKGFYWHRKHKDAGDLVAVFEDFRGELQASIWGQLSSELVKDIYGQWAGPLPPKPAGERRGE